MNERSLKANDKIPNMGGATGGSRAKSGEKSNRQSNPSVIN